MKNMPIDDNEEQKYKIAYIHIVTFPNPEANAFDAVWTASSLSERVDTTFFVPRVEISKGALRKYYGIPQSHLRFQAIFSRHLPDRLWTKFRNYYRQFLSLYLRFHPQWTGFRGKKILYVREPNQLLFWGLHRERHKWLKDWILCYESHEPPGLDPSQFQGVNPFEIQDGLNWQHRQNILQALLGFDLIICNTKNLADDLRSWTNNAVEPHVIRLASPLPRLSEPPQICSFGENIVLGYIGTIDQYRGVDILLDAMRYLPQNYKLRIVGRFRKEKGVDPNWLNKYIDDTQINSRIEIKFEVPIKDVLAEINSCDILLQPASNDIIDSRYATPQKSFGYMVRGKPIVVADVPCHRELFQDGKNAVLYQLDPKSFADCVLNLVNHPGLAERIARGAWEQSIEYNFSRRAAEILSLAEHIQK